MANIFEQTIVPKIPFSNFDLSESQIITHNFGQLIPCYVREVLPNDIFKLSAFADVEFAPMVAPMKQDCHLSIHFFFVPNRIVFEDFETFITGSEDGHALTTEEELARMPSQPGFKLSHITSFAQYLNTFLDTTRYFHSWSQSVGADYDACDWQGTLFDYLGLPTQLGQENYNPHPDLVISDIPFRDYFKIWYDYYRDENLQVDYRPLQNDPEEGQDWVTETYYDFWRNWKRTAQTNDPTKIPAALNNFLPFYRSYKKDYFTGALQSPQKGEPVTLALGSEAPVTFAQNIKFVAPENITPSHPLFHFDEGANLPNTKSDAFFSPSSTPSTDDGVIGITLDSTNYFVNSIEGTIKSNILNKPAAVADLTKASTITVEALREAFAVQEILESLSLRGSRFVEFLRGNFGVTPDDYRLQRPQFLGGIVSPVAVQKVIQTAGYSDSDSRNMTGYAAGRAFAAAGQSVFRQRFKEHGYIIGIMSVMPKAYYYQGIPRHFLRKDRFDYYLPQTAHLGEQAIENQELYFDPNVGRDNDKVFGFIPRWAEYKVSTNGIHGDFRGNLNYYHMARVFESCPTLSKEFITTENVQTRPFAVWQTENPSINHILWTSIFFKVTASRPIPYHSIPKVQ